MEEVKLLLFQENICFMCFNQDETIINIDDKIEIHEEFSNITTTITTSLRCISNYLCSYYDIITHKACGKCTKLILEMYTTIKRGLKKMKLVQEVIEKVNSELNSKSDLVGNNITIDLKEEKTVERLVTHPKYDVNKCKTDENRVDMNEANTVQTQRQTNKNSFVKKHSNIAKKKINNLSYKCNDCAYIANNKLDLGSHINRKHLNVKPYICKICQKGFFSSKNLKEHSLIHEQSNVMMCDVCGETFSYQKTLKIHMRSHINHKPYNCKSCGHKFVSVSQMNEHIKRKHGPKSFFCNLCDKKYCLQKDLRRHIKSVHKPQK